MARQSGIVVTNNFTRGLFTEATALNLPENAASEIWDVEISADKKITRRKGWEYESASFVNHTIDRSQGVVDGHLWQNAKGDGSIDVYVMQVGGTLHFFEAADPFSLTKSTTTITLSTFSPAGADTPNTVECQYSEGNGLLFVTHPFLESFYLTFTDINTIVATQINPQIRDLEGVVSLASDDATVLAVDERETADIADLNVQHKYNLFNQSWSFNSNAALSAWDTARSDMPSNVDVWWVYKDSSGDWSNAEVPRVDLGNTPAPKGHYILNVYNEDRDAASGLSGVADVTTGTQRASTSSFFSGRLWMSGINFSGRNTNVYFSQVVINPEQYDFMYQANDPTIELTPDLLASDGGVIPLPDAGNIYKLIPLKQALMVFAQKGVWAITGSTGIGFTADDFSVIKISDVATTTAKTFVVAEGVPFWWNDDGIHTLTETDNGGFKVTNIIDDTIKTFFETIPVSARKHSKGSYNPVLRLIRWLYQSEEKGTVFSLQEFDRVLTFNLRDASFIPWTIGTGDLKVHDIVTSTALNAATTTSSVVNDSAFSSTVTVTSASPGVVTWTSHGLSDDDIVQFTTTDTLPTGLSLLTDYYLQNSTTHTFEVALTAGGASVNTSSTGVGTQTATQQDNLVVEQATGNTIITTDVSGTAASPGFKYVISADDGASSYDVTFGETRDETTWTDWTTKEGTGVAYSSYIVTGYKIRGDTMRKQQTPYVTTFMEQEDGAGLLLQGLWDWSANTNSGKFTSTQQCYSSRRSNFDVNVSRLKLRGTGKSLQLKYTSQAGQPFTLLGWSQLESVSGDV